MFDTFSFLFLPHCVASKGRSSPELTEGQPAERAPAKMEKKRAKSTPVRDEQNPDSSVPLWLDPYICTCIALRELHNNGTTRSNVQTKPLEVSALLRNMFLPVCSKVSCFKQIVPSLMQRLLQNARRKQVDCCYGNTTKLFRPIIVLERGLASDVAYLKKDADVLIIGGGAMGSSAAYFIKSKSPNTNVIVIERDPKVKD